MKFLSTVLLTASLMASAVGLSADSLFSENFDGTIPTPLGTGSAGQFNVSGSLPLNTIAIFGTIGNGGGTLNSCIAPESGNCLNLAGAYDVSQVVSKNVIDFAPGSYTLSFLYGGSNRSTDTNALDSANVSIGSLLNQNFSIQPLGTPQMFTATFTVSSAQSASLTFTDTTPRPGSDSYDGVILDNIDISSSSAPPPPQTPEPASMMLLGSGVGLLALRQFRARNKNKRA
jgi:hypothetical protein